MNIAENRRPLVQVAVLVALAALMAGVVWFAASSGNHDRDVAPPTTTGATSNDGTSDQGDGEGSKRLVPASAPDNSADGVNGVKGVVLPHGEDVVDGLPVQFPYSDLGAVAVDAQVATSTIGFDYDQAAALAEVYAAPEDLAIFQQRSRDAVALARRQAGAPTNGAVPPPASYAATPIAFTVDEIETDYSTDYYVVNLLSYITLTTTSGKTGDYLYAGTQLVRWIDGDWKLVQGSAADNEQLLNQNQPAAAAPGTAKYRKAGWITLSEDSQ